MTDVAVYYFPNYHEDPRNVAVRGKGWTEWELLKKAGPRFPGHQQPKIPLWGEEDETDPQVMAKKIDAAADHGIDAFIFDWYYYNDGPFLQRGLEEGFLAAPNCYRLKFALMWANHDWLDIFPLKRSERPFEDARLLYPGAVTAATFDRIIDHCIEKYFQHPSYWLLDGCPYFSVYDLSKLMEGFGSMEETRRVLELFRERVRAAGFKDLHLNAIIFGNAFLPGTSAPADPKAIVDALGFDSITSYVWIHHYDSPHFPVETYNNFRNAYLKYWDEAKATYNQPYYPNVTMGWDASPRTVQSDNLDNLGYPFMTTIQDNTPEKFEEALRLTREKLEAENLPHPFITINAWNEWTEGSYLEPDTKYGMRYLEAVRKVFKQSPGILEPAKPL